MSAFGIFVPFFSHLLSTAFALHIENCKLNLYHDVVFELLSHSWNKRGLVSFHSQRPQTVHPSTTTLWPHVVMGVSVFCLWFSGLCGVAVFFAVNHLNLWNVWCLTLAQIISWFCLTEAKKLITDSNISWTFCIPKTTQSSFLIIFTFPTTYYTFLAGYNHPFASCLTCAVYVWSVLHPVDGTR